MNDKELFTALILLGFKKEEKCTKNYVWRYSTKTMIIMKSINKLTVFPYEIDSLDMGFTKLHNPDHVIYFIGSHQDD